jgi:A/G-specific adenine glycosylase
VARPARRGADGGLSRLAVGGDAATDHRGGGDPYFETFTRRWADVAALAAAPEEDVMAAWAGLGYYSRARRLVECARLVADMGAFPQDEAGLRALPGLGAYTAAAVASIAFGQRAVVVDGNVERVVSRLFAIDTPLPAAKGLIREGADRLTPRITPAISPRR